MLNGQVRQAFARIKPVVAQGFARACFNAFAATAAEIASAWSVVTEFYVYKQLAQKEFGAFAGDNELAVAPNVSDTSLYTQKIGGIFRRCGKPLRIEYRSS